MIINIHNQFMKKVGYMNNDLSESLHYFNENWHRYLPEGASTFDFTVSKSNPDSELIYEQAYISFMYEWKMYLFNVMNIVEDDFTKQVQCDSLNLGLINEQLNPFPNTTPHTLTWYMLNAAELDSNIVFIKRNPFSDTKVLTFDSSETKLARLISIINSWEGEFEFETTLKNDGTLDELSLNIYESGGVGIVRNDVTLFFGKNIVGVTRTVDKTQIFNATTVTDSNGKYNWLNTSKTYTNSNGIVEFYKNLNENTAYAPISMFQFPSNLKNETSDLYTHKDFQIDAKSQQDLWDYAYKQLKQYAYPLITYDVTTSINTVTEILGNTHALNFSLGIGDTVTIQDNNFDTRDGGLILSARVSEQEICFSNPLNNKMTFTNFIKLQNKVSNDLIIRMNALVDAATPYRCEVWTTNGTSFKNGTGSTELQVHVFKGSDVTEVTPDTIQWIADGTPISSGNGGNSPNLEVNASDIFQKSVISYQATFGTKTYNSPDITILDVSDGTSPINLVIESSNGYQFKNNIINTVLTARLYQDNNEIDTDGTEFVYVWTKVNADGTVDTAWNFQHQVNSKSITITNSDLFKKATFNCNVTPLL